MCDPYVTVSFLTAIPQSSCRDIQPCTVSSVDFSFRIVFIDLQKCEFGLNIDTDLSHILYLRVSHWVVPHWSAATQFAYEAAIHSLSLHKHSGWVCRLPSINISCRWHPWILVWLVQEFPNFFWSCAICGPCIFTAYHLENILLQENSLYPISFDQKFEKPDLPQMLHEQNGTEEL